MKIKAARGLILTAFAVFSYTLIMRFDGSQQAVSSSVQRAKPVDPLSPAGAAAEHKSISEAEEDKMQPAVELTTVNPGTPVIWNSLTPAAHRARAVEPQAALLAKEPAFMAGDRLILPVFEDVVLDAVVTDTTSYPNGTFGMTARLEGRYSGTVYLSVSGGEMRVHADLLDADDFYIRYDPVQQVHIAIEIDHEKSDVQEECMTCSGTLDLQPASRADTAFPDDGAEAANPPVAALDQADDSVVVDVMIVYTPAALSAEGGTNGINNNIALAMQKANTTHGNSDTKVALNLVYSGETTYTESGNAFRDLEVLTYTGGLDSEMDDVHTLRDTYSADFVLLLESNPGTGGIAWLLDDADGLPDRAFSLARVQQSDTGFTVVHEWGHNMTCGHSASQTSQQGPGFYSYSAGWQWFDGASPYDGYCTVMTYENHNGTPALEYRRVPHFSNPSVNYIGAGTNATGDVDLGDNARGIRNVRYIVADYRIPLTPVTVYPCSNSFENAYGTWQYYGTEIEWVRNSGETLSGDTGPPSGYEGNKYVYVEASFENNPNKTAVLQAVFDLSAAADPEITFAYHMYGADMGTLTLEASTNNGSSWNPLWSKSGDQGNAWYATNISLSAYAGDAETRLRFRGVTGAGFTSDMALDAIVVQDTSTDSDGDGMPNAWESLYFGGSTNAVATANPDGDLYNNLQEYIAGLNPTNSDALALFNFTAGTNNAFDWNAASGRIYNVYWTDNLLNGFSMIESNLTSGSFTDTIHAAEAAGFYRLEVEVAP
jgi:hypothetical protein